MAALVYQCAAAPNNLFCGQNGYEPGTGQYWETVWTMLGSCTGTISPTSSPSYSSLTNGGGCPGAWEAGVYEENDRVSKDGLIFQCAAFPMSGFCGQAGYEPLADDGTEYWKDAWTVVGYCSGTISVSVFRSTRFLSRDLPDSILVKLYIYSLPSVLPSIPPTTSAAAPTSG